MGRVRIGTCSGPADAALVRSVFDAHEIPIVINAEQHASVLGGLGGAFVPLHIYVDEEYAEDAAALLADLHAREAPDPELPDEEEDADESTRDEVPVDLVVARRRRTMIALLLGLSVTFGAAHASTGAWFRALALAGLEAFAIRHLVAGNTDLGTFLLIATVATDLIGAIWRARTFRPAIPMARVRR